jgi:cytochrome-b5 reductase
MALPIVRVRPILTTFAASGITASFAYTYLNRDIDADSGEPRKVFGKGPAFVSLPLESSETINHNTKRLRFKLPNENDISGLSVTCQ